MQLPNLTLRFLVSDLKLLLEGAHTRKIQAVGEHVLRIRVSTKDGTKDILIHPNAVFFSVHQIPASTHHKGFIEYLRAKIENKKIRAVYQQGFDRIVVLAIAEYFLILELFAKGNIILADSNWITLSALTKEEWKDRVIIPKKPYSFPATHLFPNEISKNEFVTKLFESPKPLVQTLVTQFNVFPLLAEELILENNLENLPSKTFSQKQLEQLHDSFSKLLSKKPDPHVLTRENEKILLPFAFPKIFAQQKNLFQSVPDFHSALDDYYSNEMEAESTATENTESKKVKALAQSLREIESGKHKFDESVLENEQKAHFVYAHYAELHELFMALNAAAAKKISSAEALQKIKEYSSANAIAKKLQSLDVKNKKVVLDV